MTYIPTQADIREEVAEKYLSDWYTADDTRALLVFFQDKHIPTIKIRKEMDKLEAVGLNRDIALKPGGCLVQILRKFTARGKNKAWAGRYIYPHLYWASEEQVANAHVQKWKKPGSEVWVFLCWVRIKDLTVVIEDFLEPKQMELLSKPLRGAFDQEDRKPLNGDAESPH